MAASIPSECPTCAAGNIRSAIKLIQVNLEEAAPSCENKECKFPLNSPDLCPLIIPHKLTLNLTSFEKRRRQCSFDTESLASNSSVSSWASGASTLSSITSSAITPPPPLTYQALFSKQKTSVQSFTNTHQASTPSSPYTFTRTTVHEAELGIVKLTKKGSLDTESLTSNCSASSWASRASRAPSPFTPPVTPVHQQVPLKELSKGAPQSSSSNIIELVGFDECMGMTPSPSVAVSDDFDAFLAELVSFSGPQEESAKAVEVLEPSLDELAETSFSNGEPVKHDKPVTIQAEPKKHKARTKPKGTDPGQDGIVILDSPPNKRQITGPECIPTYLGIELPTKRKSVRKKRTAPKTKPTTPKTEPATPKTKPTTPKTKPTTPKTKPTTPKAESSPAKKTDETATSAPELSFQLNEEGVPVFVIPLPEPTMTVKTKTPPKGRISSTKTKESLKRLRDSGALDTTPPKTPPKKKSRPRKKTEDSFDLQSLIERFRKSAKPIVRNPPS